MVGRHGHPEVAADQVGRTAQPDLRQEKHQELLGTWDLPVDQLELLGSVGPELVGRDGTPLQRRTRP
jgi:hypothetical protein